MFVAQFGLSPDPGRALGKIPKGALACVNTHDMPPFASFRNALDVDDRVSMGLLAGAAGIKEKAARKRLAGALAKFLRGKGRLPLTGGDPDDGTLLGACLAHMAGSTVETLIVGLEDLWLERSPQNVPGTWKERPNWMRKCRFSFEEFRDRPAVIDALREIARIRRGGGAK
jgi:4-alpha-glucanotransferase